MSRIPFDRDAITLSSRAANRLLGSGGFQAICTEFLFVFPRPLHRIRWTERYLAHLPLGAQYGIMCRRGGH